MTIFRRDTLDRVFPNNPRMVHDLEQLDDLLSGVQSAATELRTLLDTAQGQIDALGGEWQPSSALLSAIVDLNGQVGAVEFVAADTVVMHPVDTSDGASLLTRAGGMVNAGKGSTGSRPTIGAGIAALYFDTTLAAAGKPIFWTGTAWVDSSGTAA